MSKSLVADPPPPAPPSRTGPRRSGPPPGGRAGSRLGAILSYVAGALLIVVGVGFGFVAYRMIAQHETFSNALSHTFPPYVPSPSTVFGKDRIYVLVLGIDFNYDAKDQLYTKDARSDTILVAGIDFPSKSMKIVQVLRDTEATINGHDTKINEAYSDGGVKLADQTIGQFLGMPKNENGTYFDRYVVINPNGLRDFVDAVGGIDVPVTEQMDYDDTWGHLHIHFKPGLVHMNGEQAMGYTRFRHDACSDPCRTKRQQQVMRILMAKLKADKINDLLHVGALLGALNRNVRTNLTFDEEKSIAWSFRDANLADLSRMETIGYVDTKETPWAGEVLIPDEAQKERLVAGLLGAYGTTTPAPAGAVAAVKPATIHVVVENGSGIAGLAGTVAQKLQAQGYLVDSIRNADSFTYDTTQIRPASNAPLVGERVRSDLGVADALVTPATDATPGAHPIVTVIVGRDYASAQAAASQASAAPTSSAAPH
ncbi:MAG TPA: LCP family protein [Candidatus Baltobacteraceae bacterium]|nr:LCP family protein [Candidatus Baltobacteraceae bacterium]